MNQHPRRTPRTDQQEKLITKGKPNKWVCSWWAEELEIECQTQAARIVELERRLEGANREKESNGILVHNAQIENAKLREALASKGVELIAAERVRQINVEGWTPKHDDAHTSGQMAAAAACYAYDYAEETRYGDPGTPRQIPPTAWPWVTLWWKPKDRMSRLVRAGALIAAEIDRLTRQALAGKETE